VLAATKGSDLCCFAAVISLCCTFQTQLYPVAVVDLVSPAGGVGLFYFSCCTFSDPTRACCSVPLLKHYRKEEIHRAILPDLAALVWSACQVSGTA